jgi:dCTP deaminase
MGDGILPAQQIEGLIVEERLCARGGVDPSQVQPASLDLRLGRRAWRVRASFLPRANGGVADRIADLAMHELDLSAGAVLERGCVYIAEVHEHVRLPRDVSARANPKSSTGRLDVFVRLLTDGQAAFDDVAAGYAGPMWLEIAPQTFAVLARAGARLSQLRLRRGPPAPLKTLSVGVDLSADIIGYRARRHAGVVDLDGEAGHDPRDFWEPLSARHGALVLDPGEFYILSSRERIEIGALEAAEMTPIDPAVGEFRAHYAGFFDPGFGAAEAGGEGSRAVLEVRSHETPFLLEDGQTVARLTFEAMAERPSRLYGAGGSHYQRQGLRLAKHFREWEA